MIMSGSFRDLTVIRRQDYKVFPGKAEEVGQM